MIRHLYVHIPFCHRICPYCSFYKHEPGGTDPAAFLGALTAELRMAQEQWPGRIALETIYFGGGTPSLLSTGHLERWLPEFVRTAGAENLREWTVEINPRTIDDRKAAVLRGAGVTRASLGVQAWDAPTLATLGRDHSPAEAEQAYHVLRSAGFPVVNIDLMFAVPRQPLAAWRSTLEHTIGLGPEHVSAYNLTYEEDTPFFEKFQRGEYLRDEAVDEAFFGSAADLLGAAGFSHYEISNYARAGCESQHNRSYWRGEDYLGLGPGAVSTIDRTRWKNVENTTLYLSQMQARKSAAGSVEDLTDEQWACERVALELRTSEGVDESFLAARPRVDEAAAAGLAERSEGRVRLTRRGMFVADSVAEFLWIG